MIKASDFILSLVNLVSQFTHVFKLRISIDPKLDKNKNFILVNNINLLSSVIQLCKMIPDTFLYFFTKTKH